MLKKPLTLNQTWTLCLRMWRWVAKTWKPGNNVEYLKRRWLYNNGYKEASAHLSGNCFFCEYSNNESRPCDFSCPGCLVDPTFDCFNPDYEYDQKPREFYQKLLELNRIRKNRRTKK